jgi:FixJ family two-component response regulator
MTKQVLCVDDEPNVLQAFERQFHRRFELRTAQGPERALDELAVGGPFAVVVSDLRMPGMDGIEFLRRVREQWPDTVRIMLTGQADLNAAIAAVNQGSVFQFLTKPCPAEMLGRAIDAALEQHRLVQAERELLEQTLRGSIGVMSEILSLSNPLAFSRSERIRNYVLHIAKQLNLEGQWQYELAAMLSQIGCVAVPPEVLQKYYNVQPLDSREQEILSSQGRIGQKLLAQIPRLEEVADMVANQSSSAAQSASLAPSVATGSRLLRVALAFDELIMRGSDAETALEHMRSRGTYPIDFLEALEQVHVERGKDEVRLLPLGALKAGMVTNCDVFAKSGPLIMGTGQVITESAIARLKTFALTVGIVEPISVRLTNTEGVPVAMASGR